MTNGNFNKINEKNYIHTIFNNIFFRFGFHIKKYNKINLTTKINIMLYI